MKINFSLNGEYKLYIYDVGTAPAAPSEISGEYFTATVPGNVELDLMKAGVLPDLYLQDNIEQARFLENKEFWLVREFDFPHTEAKKAFIEFDGVDTFATYYLNGVKLGNSDNAFIAHAFPVEGVIKAGKNVLAVRIGPALENAKEYKIRPYNVAFPGCYESLFVRKPAHGYGWDILPRALSAGIYRDARIVVKDEVEIEDLYISTLLVEGDLSILILSLNADIPTELQDKCRLHFYGACGDSRFDREFPMRFNCLTVYPYIYGAKLWYPNGAGEQNLYEMTAEIVCEGKVLARKDFRYGIRKLKLCFSDKTGDEGNFFIEVNGKLLRCRGANWTPLDVYHSRDKEKYKETVESLYEANCNIVRVWGGGVYEGEEFFELCDEKGILVWQDMMIACHAYPMDGEFAEKMKTECERVAMRIRNHSSLALYCGSNETDWAYVCVGLDPNDDKLTREVIKNALYGVDPYRDYLPSTPYFSREFIEKYGGRFLIDLQEIEEQRKPLPEEHYWWHRDDFLYFPNQNHRFIAEIGYSGSPPERSLKKFLPKGFTFEDDGAWKGHSFPTETSRRTGYGYLFFNLSDKEENKIAASAFYQAEAYKFIVEKSRINPKNNGIILWNLRDGFPEFSSALIDYYGEKKPAFFVVKSAYEPLQSIVDIIDGRYAVYLVNDTGRRQAVKLCVKDDRGETLFEENVELSADRLIQECFRGELKDEKALLTAIEKGGKRIENYRWVYEDKIDFAEYSKLWYKTLKALVHAD